MRDVQPATDHRGTSQHVDARQCLFFDFAKLREIHGRYRRDAATSADSGGNGGTINQKTFDVSLDVAFEDAATRSRTLDFTEIHVHFAGEFTHGGAGVSGGEGGFVNFGIGSSRSSNSRGWRRSGRRFGRFYRGSRRCLWRFCRRCCGWCSSGTAANGSDQIALFDFIADSDGNTVHFSGDFRWYFHRGFVGFQYQHGLADFDGITGFDQYFDDINGVKIANVGDANFIAHFNILFLFWN